MSRKLLQKLVSDDCQLYAPEFLFAKVHKVGLAAVLGCVNPKYTAWKYLLPFDGNGVALVFETGLGIDTLAIAPFVGKTVTVCSSEESARVVRSRVDSALQSNNVLVVAAGMVDSPFDWHSFDFIVARDFPSIFWEGMSWISCRSSIVATEKLLKDEGIALVGIEAASILDIKHYLASICKRTNEWLLSVFFAVMFYKNKNVFCCLPEHFVFDEIVLPRESYYRQIYLNSIKDFVKKIIIKLLFPMGAPSANYFIRKSNRSIKLSLLERVLADVPKYLCQEGADFTVHRIIVGNPCTLLCFVSSGSCSYILRIPINEIALARAGQQFETLNFFSRDMINSFGVPKVYPPYAVLGQFVYIEEMLHGVVVDDKKDLEFFQEDMAVDWITQFHLMTESDSVDDLLDLRAKIQYSFEVLLNLLNNEYDIKLLRQLQNKTLESYSLTIAKTVCMHGDYKIENMMFSSDMKKINGVFDWDLSLRHGLPVVDLYYFIAYSAYLRDPSMTIVEIFVSKFIDGLLLEHEEKWIATYMDELEIAAEQQLIYVILAWLNHVVYRTNHFQFSNIDLYNRFVHVFLEKSSSIEL